ncbi:MAG TPA: sulfatase [Gammaproteobacteria bacterium]|nr:sulfatase [Gammaproteobacteria bacterium]
MQSPQCILALQHPSGWDAWTKITAACKARRVTSLSCLKVVLLGALVFSAPSGLVAQTATRPNIVVIMTDDQTLESLRVMSKTRTLLGDEGTTFRNFYCSFPLCAPSRATFLTGQYAHNHGVLGNQAPEGGYTALNHNNTLAVWLQDAGYFTSHIGKYLNGYGRLTPTTLVPPGWTDWQGLVDNSTYSSYNYTINDNGTLVTYGETEADYQTDVLTNRAVATIDEAMVQQPFFLSIATLAPHVESAANPPSGARPPPRYIGAFKNEPLYKPPSFNEANVSDKPAEIRRLPLLDASNIQQRTSRYRGELGALLAVDDLVERVVNELAATGVLNNTVVIFTSDNGLFHGEHRIRAGKSRVYEEASHVPLLIRGPGFPQGITAKQVVANIDLAPTIVDFAGADARREMDGRSLLALAQDSSVATGRSLLIEAQGKSKPSSEEGAIVKYKAVRNKSFLYVEYTTGERELYDMRPGTANYDPYQLRSRHASSAYNQIKTQLRTKLSKLRTCSGTSCAVQ